MQARTMSTIIPTNDNAVRVRLRQLGEPITYFGEDKADRRARLTKIVNDRIAQGLAVTLNDQTDSSQPEADEDTEMPDVEEEEEFYTPGSDDLISARKHMLKYSLNRAKQRIEGQKSQASMTLNRQVRQRRQILGYLKEFELVGSQSGFDRAVSSVAFSPDTGSSLLAVGDWAGSLKILDSNNLETAYDFGSVHSGNISGIAWNPMNSQVLATGGLEGAVKVWKIGEKAAYSNDEIKNQKAVSPIFTLTGHEGRVCKIDHHPCGRYLASASYDYTWRLWDIEAQLELQVQEGHAKEVFAVKFQGDGALVGSAGLDAIGRIWDIRTGRTVMVLDGHVKPIYALDFAPNGYQVVSGGADNQAIVWDLRQIKPEFTIPAHTSMISDIKFYKGETESDHKAGTFLVTASYDRTVKVWAADSWLLQRTFEEPDKITSADISRDMTKIATARWDRYVNLWERESSEVKEEIKEEQQ